MNRFLKRFFFHTFKLQNIDKMSICIVTRSFYKKNTIYFTIPSVRIRLRNIPSPQKKPFFSLKKFLSKVIWKTGTQLIHLLYRALLLVERKRLSNVLTLLDPAETLHWHREKGRLQDREKKLRGRCTEPLRL